MIAAAAGELLSGGIPVVDNRPAQSVAYLNAIVAAAGARDDLLHTLDGAGREVALLADQLEDTLRATNVPTIVVDDGAVRVQQPRSFSVLLEPGHVESHLAQLASLAERS